MARAQDSKPAHTPSVGVPELVESVAAEYPAEARVQGLEATVRLKLTIDAEGRVTDAEIVTPAGHGFDEAAQTAARKFRFAPATRHGKPVSARILHDYVFSLPRESVPIAPVAPAAPIATEKPRSAPAEVSVRGDAPGTRLARSAEAVSVIDMRRAHHQSADLGEIMARSPGITVRREGGLGSNARFSLNGFQDEQVRFFVDGVPLQYTGLTFGIANVPVDFLERVEVYRGVVPIRFGADALGGAVNLVTEPRRGNRATGSYQVGSFATYRATAGGQYYDRDSGFFARVNTFYDRSKNNYPVDVTVAVNSRSVPATVHRFHDGYGAFGAGLEAGLLDRWWARRLSLRVYGTDIDKDVQNDPTMKDSYGEVRYADTTFGSVARYQSPAVRLGSTKLSFSALGGYNHRSIDFIDRAITKYNWFGRPTAPTGDNGEIGGRSKTDQVTREHTVFQRLGLEWVLSPALTLRGNASPTWVSRQGEQKLPIRPGDVDPLSARRKVFTWTNGVEAELNLFGRRLQNVAFVKSYYIHSQSEQLLSVTQAIPIDRTSLTFGAGNALRYQLSSWLYGKASYEHATRLPSAHELFGDAALVQGNPALVPETSDNFNFGFLVDTTHPRTGNLRAEVNGFLRYSENLITPIISSTSYVYQNVYSARSAGGEALVAYRSPGDYLGLEGSFTLQDFRNTSGFADTKGNRIPNHPWLFGSVTARGKLPRVLATTDEVSLAWTTRYVNEFFLYWEGQGDPNQKLRIGSQLVHSLALTYLVRIRGAQTVSATLEAQNLADSQVFDNFGVQKPGRAFFFKGTFEQDWGAQ